MQLQRIKYIYTRWDWGTYLSHCRMFLAYLPLPYVAGTVSLSSERPLCLVLFIHSSQVMMNQHGISRKIHKWVICTCGHLLLRSQNCGNLSFFPWFSILVWTIYRWSNGECQFYVNFYLIVCHSSHSRSDSFKWLIQPDSKLEEFIEEQRREKSTPIETLGKLKFYFSTLLSLFTSPPSCSPLSFCYFCFICSHCYPDNCYMPLASTHTLHRVHTSSSFYCWIK